MSEIQRQRTYTWQDPMVTAKGAMGMTGMEFFKAMSAGSLPTPPLMHTLDFNVELTNEGEIVFSFIPQEFHYNPIGSVHGGVIVAALDSAMGCCLHALLPAGKAYTTIELKTNFTKAVTAGTGPVKAHAKMLNLGSRTALVEARLVDEAGKLYAHAVSTCMIFSLEQNG